MNPKLLKEIRGCLMRAYVLLGEDVDELPDLETKRHQACMEEIDRLLDETKTAS